MIECRGRNKWFTLSEAYSHTISDETASVSMRSKKPFGDMPPIYFSGPILEMVALLDKLKREVLDAFIQRFGGLWGSHPQYARQEWMDEAGNNDTSLGYWDWVLNKIDIEELDQEVANAK